MRTGAFFSLFLLFAHGVSAQTPPTPIPLSSDSAQSGYAISKKDTLGKKYVVVQRAASFPGGLLRWQKYLQTNLNADLGARYLKVPKGQKEVQQSVMVNFLIDEHGIVSEAFAENAKDVHPKLAAEAIRVLQSSPRWIPAQQEMFDDSGGTSAETKILARRSTGGNFKKVIFHARETITFSVTIE